MEFVPAKSELLHLTRSHAVPTIPVRLGTDSIAPSQEGRFLGVWLGRKLRWKGHLTTIKRKLAT